MMLRETEDAVRKLNMQVEVVDAQTSDEFERAFAQLTAKSADGVVLLPDPTSIEHSRRIAELAQSARLPTAFQHRENVDAGGLGSSCMEWTPTTCSAKRPSMSIASSRVRSPPSFQ
jgi:DNA-binding LacI/PurR family transcriptional regulator